MCTHSPERWDILWGKGFEMRGLWNCVPLPRDYFASYKSWVLLYSIHSQHTTVEVLFSVANREEECDKENFVHHFTSVDTIERPGSFSSWGWRNVIKIFNLAVKTKKIIIFLLYGGLLEIKTQRCYSHVYTLTREARYFVKKGIWDERLVKLCAPPSGLFCKRRELSAPIQYTANTQQ